MVACWGQLDFRPSNTSGEQHQVHVANSGRITLMFGEKSQFLTQTVGFADDASDRLHVAVGCLQVQITDLMILINFVCSPREAGPRGRIGRT